MRARARVAVFKGARVASPLAAVRPNPSAQGCRVARRVESARLAESSAERASCKRLGSPPTGDPPSPTLARRTKPPLSLQSVIPAFTTNQSPAPDLASQRSVRMARGLVLALVGVLAVLINVQAVAGGLLRGVTVIYRARRLIGNVPLMSDKSHRRACVCASGCLPGASAPASQIASPLDAAADRPPLPGPPGRELQATIVIKTGVQVCSFGRPAPRPAGGRKRPEPVRFRRRPRGSLRAAGPLTQPPPSPRRPPAGL
jgi:hypothetical protein